MKLPHILSDQTFKNNMKVIEDRLKRFIQADAIVIEQVEPPSTEPTEPEPENQPSNVEEVAIIYPEHVTNSLASHENDEEVAECLNVKFTYNSPLDFLRSNKNKYANNKKPNSSTNNILFHMFCLEFEIRENKYFYNFSSFIFRLFE